MRALRLFLAISLSLSATAHGDFMLQRRDGIPVKGVGIFNRDPSMPPRSNTSDVDLLNINSKWAPDDPSLVPRESVTSGVVKLKLKRSLFTGIASFNGQSVLSVMDTGSSVTWVRSSSYDRRGSSVFQALTFYQLRGRKTKRTSTVKLEQGLTSKMQFATVGGQDSDSDHYEAAIALDRSSTSWSKSNVNNIPAIFGFYSLGNKAEFDFGKLDDRYTKHMEWHKVGPGNPWTPLNKAKFKVHGVEVEEVVFSAMINSGVPYVYGSPSNVVRVYQQVPNSKHVKFPGEEEKEKKRGAWMFPCSENLPVISISWGERDFIIEDFTVHRQSSEVDGQKYCRGVLRTHKGLSDDNVLLGAGFLYDKYTGFQDVEGDEKVGFVTLQHSASAHTTYTG